MARLSFPTLSRKPNRSVFSYDANTVITRSWLTGYVRATSFGGERWDCTLFYDHLEQEDRQTLVAFIAKLNGQQNRVDLPVFGHTQRGTFGGTPLVQGDGQIGTTLLVDGCTPSVTNWIRQGDYFSVNGELKMATADASSDSSGEITLTFRPRIRNAPSDDASIETSNPTGTFVLAEPRTEWTMRPGTFSDFSLQFVEALT